jgi:tRNA splicing endonuclease
MSEIDFPIPLFLTKSGSVRVWKTSHAIYLRQERIYGSWIGSSASSMQELGLPFDLLPEQVTLLLEYGWAQLFVDESGEASQDQINQFQQDFNLQIQEYQTLRLVKSDKIKQFKLENTGQMIPSHLLSQIQLPVETPTAADHYVWNQNTTLAVWNWPCTDDQNARYKIFKHLYEMGYHITRGSKFGGDYLLYNGSPDDYHSDFIVIIANQNQTFSSKEIIAMGRLGTAVKKSNVLCSWSEKFGFISICFNWEGLA